MTDIPRARLVDRLRRILEFDEVDLSAIIMEELQIAHDTKTWGIWAMSDRVAKRVKAHFRERIRQAELEEKS